MKNPDTILLRVAPLALVTGALFNASLFFSSLDAAASSPSDAVGQKRRFGT